MDSQSHLAFPSTFDIQTLRPKLRLRGPLVLLIICSSFPLFFFLEHGINRAFHSGLCALALVFVLFHWRKEYALIQDHQSAMAVVTEFKKLWEGAPRIKYSFVAFNGQTYAGQTGWNTRGLRLGVPFPVLYRAANPSINLPFPSFIFYSFH